MSGHSKWATTKYRKGAQDKARAKLFAKLIRQIEVAAREGGGDLNANANLRTAYAKARDGSVPMDTIERAIKRGTGELEGVKYDAISYEGYGPNGVAVIVECLSDNRNRTGSEIKTIFSRNSGAMAEPGSVSWQFSRKAVVLFETNQTEEEVLDQLLECNVEDLTYKDGSFKTLGEPGSLHEIVNVVNNNNWTLISAENELVPSQQVALEDITEVKKVFKLLETLDEHDDVQNVYDNAFVADSILKELEDQV
jgi:YebC/PmpR family DNA-binding regulatory protein